MNDYRNMTTKITEKTVPKYQIKKTCKEKKTGNVFFLFTNIIGIVYGITPRPGGSLVSVSDS